MPALQSSCPGSSCGQLRLQFKPCTTSTDSTALVQLVEEQQKRLITSSGEDGVQVTWQQLVLTATGGAAAAHIAPWLQGPAAHGAAATALGKLVQRLEDHHAVCSALQHALACARPSYTHAPGFWL